MTEDEKLKPFMQVGMAMVSAIEAIVSDLKCEEETTHQRLQDVRRRIALMKQYEEAAREARRALRPWS